MWSVAVWRLKKDFLSSLFSSHTHTNTHKHTHAHLESNTHAGYLSLLLETFFLAFFLRSKHAIVYKTEHYIFNKPYTLFDCLEEFLVWVCMQALWTSVFASNTCCCCLDLIPYSNNNKEIGANVDRLSFLEFLCKNQSH